MDCTAGREPEFDHDDGSITWDEIDADAEANPISIIRLGQGEEVMSQAIERFNPRDH